MKWPYFLSSVFCWIIHAASLFGQFYSTGETPASVQWSRIETRHFDIVFPSQISVEANNLANKLEQIKPLNEADLHFRARRFPVVLHNTSVLSNGYVTWAPRRMELVSVPPQNAYPMDWISQLALHEHRHVVQLSKLNQGFTRVLSWFSGEIAPGTISSMIPSWFYEGDAVYSETSYSISGRGKIPGFEMPLRTLLLQQQPNYSYDKAFFGSFRNFVPDHYLYGYQLVNHVNANYGCDIWSNALNYTAKHPFFIWPLAFYLKKNLGIFKNGLYRQSLDTLKKQYNNQENAITYINYESKNVRQHPTYTSYSLPRDLGKGYLLTLRKGLDDPGSFIIIDSMGREEKLFTTGYSTGLKCDVAGNLLVWDELTSDPRWGQRDYSIIRIFDLKSRKHKILTSATRYFSPDFSPDGQKIAVAETDLKNRNYVTMLDARSGEKLLQVPVPENRSVQFPEWISNSEIVVITISNQGKQLESIDLTSGKWTVLFPFTAIDISEPVNYKKYILLRGSFKGIENIYAIKKSKSSAIFQVTFARFGAYHPSVSKDSTELMFSSYSQSGFDIVGIPLDTMKWLDISYSHDTISHHTLEKQGVLSSFPAGDSVPEINYPTRPYRKAFNLFRFHSWTPFYASPEEFTGSIREIPINLGVKFYSQNLLSTVISSIGYRYIQGYHEFVPTLTWRGWYPVIEFTGHFGGPVSKLHIKSYIPLLFTRGRYITWLQPQVEYEYSDSHFRSTDGYATGIDFLHYKFYLSHYLRLSLRDLYPRWGQYMIMAYTNTPFERAFLGNMISFQAGGYFPGIMAHHHIHSQVGLQIQNKGNAYLPYNRISFPRGYPSAASKELASVLFNYSFPAGYPDLSLGPLLYIKRFRVNLFHDWSYGTDIQEIVASDVVNYTGSFRSYGAELLADLHVIRIIFPVSAGIRLGYMPQSKKKFYEVLLTVETGIF